MTFQWAFAADAPAPSKPGEFNPRGTWLGQINAGGLKLRLGFVIQEAGDGKLTARLFSIDQGNVEIPIDKVEVKGDSIEFGVKAVAGSMTGKWDVKTDEIDGEWKQGGQTLKINLKRVDALPGSKRPQDPQPPFPYRATEVTFKSDKHDVTLQGTLTLPMGKGPFPAAVLITGSGPQDRNEALMGHRPFLVLADALTRRGIAVLRYDDRDFTKKDLVYSVTSSQYADDVTAAVEYLLSVPEVDKKKIGLIGHSEGGIIAPMVAARDKRIAFIVMLAGPGISGDKILMAQRELSLKKLGADERALKEQHDSWMQIYEVIKSEPDDDKAVAKMEKQMEPLFAGIDAEKKKALLKQFRTQIQLLLTPWFRAFIAYDPRPTLTKVTCPVLAINGEKDCQVLPLENLPIVEEALKEAGNKDFTVKELSGLNHLFQTCKTGMADEYATIEETFNPEALKLVCDWVVEKTAK